MSQGKAWAMMGLVFAVAAPAWASDPVDEPALHDEALSPSAIMRPDNLNGAPHEAMARLLVDQTALVPGEKVRIGVHLQPDPGWHAYWKAPGETGEPMTIEWTLPDGTTTTEPVFPVPERFNASGIISFGYPGSVLLYTEATVPDGLAEGPVTLGAQAGWLVCEDQCIKGEVELSTEISVAASAEPSLWLPVFEHYTAQHPTPLAAVDGAAIESALSRTAVHPGETFQAVFRLVGTGDEPVAAGAIEGQAGWPLFTPISDPYSTWVNEVAVSEAEDGSTLVVLTVDAYELDELPTDATIGGLFQFQVGGQDVATELEIPLPWAPAEQATQASTSPLFPLAGIDLGSGGSAEAAPVEPSEAFQPAAPEEEEASLLKMLAMAFGGGLLLNIMPCVLPVLSLKLFGLVSHSGASASYQRRAGIAYTVGVLASFLALAAAVIGIKATAGAVGWGFQFQSPLYVAALCTVVFVFSLSLFGVFEVPALGSGVAGNATAKEGLAGDFMNGVFATLLATPCTAPLLGPAIGYAFKLNSFGILAFFAVIAIGLALPFLIVAFIPALFSWLPKPGPWMETFKQAMGFALLGSAVWVAYPLPTLIGGKAFATFLAFLTVVGAACWLFGRFGGIAESGQRQATVGLAALGLTAVGGWMFLDLEYDDAPVCDDNTLATDLSFSEDIPWQPFSEDRLAAASVEAPVFIDFTADWCVTCKVNERTVLDTAPVRQAMANCGIIPLKADWTRRDEVITDWLMRYGRAGVPFYLYVPPGGGDPVPLPELLTSGTVLDTIQQDC